MGLFDTLVLPDEIELPELDAETAVYRNDEKRWWQTKSLTCGQDLYRLRPLYDEDDYYVGGRRFTGGFQLERRVPPLEKQTKDGNFRPDNNEIMWWNIVRPTCTLSFGSYIQRDDYTFEVELHNGVTNSDFELVEYTENYWDESGSRVSDNYWRWYIDTGEDPTIWGRDILVADVVATLQSDDPDERFITMDLDAGEIHKVLDYYRSHRSEFDVTVEDETVTQWMRVMVQRMEDERDG